MKKGQITQKTILNDALFEKGIDKLTTEFRILVLEGRVNVPKKLLISLGKLESLSAKIGSLEQLLKVLE